MKNIVCMKWGTCYGAEYVNRLYRMVTRHITPPFRFVCLTDDSTGIINEVECLPCPEINLPAPYESYNNRPWRKISLWGKQVADLEGEVLFLDLDVVITNSLDCFFDYGDDFCVIRNWRQPKKRIGNTSVYRFTVGSHPYLLDALQKNPGEVLSKYPNSQTYISHEIKKMTFWPDDWCKSFKVHCVPKGILRWFKTPTLPDDARVIAFPGHPNPHEALAGQWPAKRWYKKIYKCIRPTPWIADYWGTTDS